MAQLTGNYDPDGLAHENFISNWGCLCVDLGANTAYDGATFIFFGDVVTPNSLKYRFNINTVKLFVDSNLVTKPKLSLSSPKNVVNNYEFNKVNIKYGDLFIGHPKTEWSGEDPGVWTLTNPKANAKLDKDNCRDIIAIVGYEVP